MFVLIFAFGSNENGHQCTGNRSHYRCAKKSLDNVASEAETAFGHIKRHFAFVHHIFDDIWKIFRCDELCGDNLGERTENSYEKGDNQAGDESLQPRHITLVKRVALMEQGQDINPNGWNGHQVGVDVMFPNVLAVQAGQFFEIHPCQAHGHKNKCPDDLNTKFFHDSIVLVNDRNKGASYINFIIGSRNWQKKVCGQS